MSDNEARDYVNLKHPSWHDNGVGIVQGSHYRSGFVAGAEWQASRKVEITDEVVERMARMLFAQTTEARSGFTWPINGDWDRKRDMERARKVLEYVLTAALGGGENAE